MLQEQNYRHILTSGRPERRFTTEELTFSIPTTTTTGTGVQTPPIAPSTRTVLTSNEITQTTTNYIYQDIVNPLNTDCPITREAFEDTDPVTKINYCGHIFKRANLHLWLSIHSNCPMCRHDLRTDLRRQSSASNSSPSYDQMWSEIRGTIDNINTMANRNETNN